MSALVVGAAPTDRADDAFYGRLLAQATAVVAADAAGEWCVSLGRTPDLVVGDFDGSDPGAAARLAAAGVDVVALPADKDLTDLEAAVSCALERFGAPLTVTRAFSGRPDHTLAAVGVLTRAGAQACVREPGWSAMVVHAGERARIPVGGGATFSVLALGRPAGVDVTGARWPLERAELAPLSGHGVSNVADADEVVCALGEGGPLLVMWGPLLTHG